MPTLMEVRPKEGDFVLVVGSNLYGVVREEMPSSLLATQAALIEGRKKWNRVWPTDEVVVIPKQNMYDFRDLVWAEFKLVAPVWSATERRLKNLINEDLPLKEPLPRPQPVGQVFFRTAYLAWQNVYEVALCYWAFFGKGDQ